jgi:hypothetical protein
MGDRGWAQRLLQWRPDFGQRLRAEVSAARYFVELWGCEFIAWAEPRELGGRRRIEVGTFGTVDEARAACERDAQQRLQREPVRGPVSVAISKAERRRQRREGLGLVPKSAGASEEELRAESERIDAALRAWAVAIGEEG